MGVYAESDVEIECEDSASARKVFDLLVKKEKKFKKDGAYDGDGVFRVDSLEVDGCIVSGKMASGRVQNLEYQCEQLWECIKDIDGVLCLNAPFMIEGEGSYFSNE